MAHRAVIRVAKWGLIGAIGIVALAVAMVTWLTQTAHGRALVTDRVLTALNESVFVGELQVGALSGPVFGRVGLQDAVIIAPDGHEQARLDGLEIRYGLRPLLEQRVDVRSVVVQGLSVEARILEDGTLDLAGIFQPGPPADPEVEPKPLPVSVHVHTIDLQGASVLLRDERTDEIVVDVAGLVARAEFELERDGAMRVQVGELDSNVALPSVVDAGWALRLAGVDVELQSPELSVRVAEVHLDDTELIGFEGTVTMAPDSDAPFANVDVAFPRFALTPDELNPLVGQDVLLAPIRFGAQVSGPPNEIRLEVPVDGPEGRVELSATLDVTRPGDLGYAAEVRLIRVRPGAWLSLGDFDADVSAGLYLRGTGVTPAAAELEARLEVGPSRVGPFAVEEAFISADYTGGELRVPRAYVRSRGAELTLHGHANRAGSVGLELDLEVPDLAATVDDVVASLERDGGAAVQRGVVALDIDAAGELPLEAWARGELPTGVAGWSEALATLTMALELEVNDLEAFGIRLADAEVTARVGADAEEPAVDLMVRASRLAAGGLDVPMARANASLNRQRLTIDLDTLLPELTGRTRLRAVARDAENALSVRLSRLEVSPQGVDIALAQPATIWLEGPWSAPERIRMEGLTATARGATVEVSADVSLNPARLPEGLAVDALVAGLDVRAWEDVLPIDAVPDLQAVLAARVSVDGTLQRPVLAARIESPSVLLDGAPPSALALDARCADGVCGADLVLAALSAGAPRVELTGVQAPVRVALSPFAVTYDERGAIAGRLRVESLQLEALEPWVPSLSDYGVEGDVVGSVAVGGTLGAPDLDLEVQWSDVAASGPAPVTVGGVDGTLTGTIREASLESAALDLQLGTTWRGRELIAGQVHGDLDLASLIDGTYDPRGQAVEASLSVARIDAADLPEPLRALVGIDTGWLELELDYNGTVDDPGGAVTARVGDVTVGGMGPIQGAARVMAGQGLSVTAGVQHGEDERPLMELAGHVDVDLSSLLQTGLDRSAELDLEVELMELPLATFASFVPQLTGETATVHGHLTAGGTVGAPELDGSVALEELRLIDGGSGAWSIHLVYGPEATTVDVVLQASGVDVVTASGRVEIPRSDDGVPVDVMDWPITLALQADDAPLEQMVPATAVVELLEDVSGSVDADVEFFGTLRRPDFDGVLNVEDAAASIIPLGRSFEGVRLAATIDDAGLRVDELRLGDEDGFVTGSGMVVLDGIGLDRYDMAFRFRDLFVSDPSSGDGVNLRGDVRIDGAVTDELHAVDVVLDRLRVTVPGSTGGGSGGPTALPAYVYFVGEDVQGTEVGEREPEFMGVEQIYLAERSPTPLRLHIVTEGVNELRHPLIEATYEVDLTFDIVGSEIRDDGTVTITSGGVSVASNRFEVDRGILRFGAGGDPLDPVVDVVAVHELTSEVTERVAAVYGPPSGSFATINLMVNGRASDLAEDIEAALRLSSDPGMPEPDIFLVLATGRLSGDGDTSEAQEGVRALTDLLIGLASDRIGDALFLDQLRIEASSESQRIEGGKYIADNLYVSGAYIRTPGEQEDNNFEVSLQWILSQMGAGSWRFELRGGDQAKGGLELVYQITRRARDNEDP